MNAAEADDALTEAETHRDEAARMLERAKSAAHVAERNRESAQNHYDAMVAWVQQRERVVRELTIANDGGYHPTNGSEA
jgi:uncharacterized iron-regulated protein